MYLLLLSVIYLTFISLGLPDSLLGSGWPTIYAELNIPISYLGIISMIISGATILSSLMTDKVVARFGTRIVTAASVLLTAISILGFSYSKEFYQMCLWGIPYGLGAGAIDASLNNYVALHYNSKHMSWLHCFWGVGTIISPYVMSFALSRTVWQDGYRIVSGIQFVIAMVIILSLPLWRANESKSGEDEKIEPLGIKGTVKTTGALPVMIGFLSYCAAEATATLWTSSYFEGVYHMSKEGAAALGSIFFIGMTSGRFISGFISERIGDIKMIKYGTCIAFIGVILILIPIKEIAIAGFIIFGLGCAPIYPSIVHSTPARFGKEKSQSIIGIQMAAAYIGATFMPPLFGLIANHISLKILPLYVAIFLVLMTVMLRKADKDTLLDRKKDLA